MNVIDFPRALVIENLTGEDLDPREILRAAVKAGICTAPHLFVVRRSAEGKLVVERPTGAA